MNKILSFKKIVSIGFFAVFLAVFLSAGTAQASFWDWFNLNKAKDSSSQQQAAAIANAETATYHALTVAKGGTGSGVVETSKSSYSFNSDGTTCYNCFKNGTVVNLVAKADSGSSFVSWTGCANYLKGNSCQVTMTSARSVTANFNTVDTGKILKVSKTVGGTVTSSDGKINCGSSCDASYSENVVVLLTAKPDTGYKFERWVAGWTGGEDCGMTGVNADGSAECKFTMAKARVVRANFKKLGASSSSSSSSAGTVRLQFINKPTGGTITSSDSVINCGAGGNACGTSYAKDTEITLTATPSSGYMFDGSRGWRGVSGGCSSVGNQGLNNIGNYTCKFKINKNTNLDVKFVEYASITVNKSDSGTGSGVVNVSSNRINTTNCDFNSGVGTSCFTYAPKGISVKLTAKPSAGSSFAGWSRDACAVSSQDKKVCTITLDSAKTVSAIFKTQ